MQLGHDFQGQMVKGQLAWAGHIVADSGTACFVTFCRSTERFIAYICHVLLV